MIVGIHGILIPSTYPTWSFQATQTLSTPVHSMPGKSNSKEKRISSMRNLRYEKWVLPRTLPIIYLQLKNQFHPCVKCTRLGKITCDLFIIASCIIFLVKVKFNGILPNAMFMKYLHLGYHICQPPVFGCCCDVRLCQPHSSEPSIWSCSNQESIEIFVEKALEVRSFIHF